MNRVEIINTISALIGALQYLEIGIAEGNTLVNVNVPNKVGVDPNPRYKAMDKKRIEEIHQIEIHEIESDHFFFYNTRYFDVVFVDGLHIYEQAIKDILNSLNFLNHNGFVVVHDILPKDEKSASRDRSTFEWNGDVWKVVYDIYKNYPDIGYFVSESDAGLGVMWKKNGSNFYLPKWNDDIRDLSYRFFEENGKFFLNRVKPDVESIKIRLSKSLRERNRLSNIYPDQNKRCTIDSYRSCISLIENKSGIDGVWKIQEDRYIAVEKKKFYSNYSESVFKKKICFETGGNIYFPGKHVYVLNNAYISPCIESNGKWPYLWHVNDQYGNNIRDLPQRTDNGSSESYTFTNPYRLKGEYLYLGWFCPYFGHYFTEMFPQLWYIDLFKNENLKLIFNIEPDTYKKWKESNNDLKKFMLQVFDLIGGVKEESIYFVERETLVEKLIAPTPINRYRRGCGMEIFEIAQKALQVVPRKDIRSFKRIYLSRKKHHGRRLINADQIEKIFKMHGFEVIYPEILPLTDQIHLASNAEIIAGEEGSALTLAIFARNPTIIELESGRFHPNIAKISYNNAIKYGYIIPYSSINTIPHISNASKIYAHPWVVAKSLNEILGGMCTTKSIQGPIELANMIEHAVFCSLNKNFSGTFQIIVEVINKFGKIFPIEWIAGLFENLAQNEHSDEVKESLASVASKLIVMYRKNFS